MKLAATVGFLSGAAPPLAYGIWILIDANYLSGAAPHSHYCGWQDFAGWMHVLCVAPIGGVVGAVIGGSCSAIYRWFRPTGQSGSV